MDIRIYSQPDRNRGHHRSKGIQAYLKIGHQSKIDQDRQTYGDNPDQAYTGRTEYQAHRSGHEGQSKKEAK